MASEEPMTSAQAQQMIELLKRQVELQDETYQAIATLDARVAAWMSLNSEPLPIPPRPPRRQPRAR